jgi:hypothetical protein
MRHHPLITTLSMLLLGQFASTQNSSEKTRDPAKAAEHVMDMHVAFTQLVPSGMSIEAKEVSRTGSGKDLVVQYHIFVRGVPPDTRFQSVTWPISRDEPSPVIGGVSVGKNGILMCADDCGDPKKPDDPIEFTTMPAKGEPARMAFATPNFTIGVVMVPDPIEANDRGCTLSAVRLTPKFELAFVSGSGYPANSKVHYRVSGNKTADSVGKSDETGTIRFSLIPHPGQDSKGTIRIKVMESKCSPEIAYEWGIA